MTRCRSCPRRPICRVPDDLHRFHALERRLEQEQRDPALRERLHYYVNHQDCLVEAGYVTL